MIETSINPGFRGQTRSSWRDETHLRGVLLRLIAEHPNASRDHIKAMYGAKVEMVPELIEEAWTRAFDNDWGSIHKPARTTRPHSAEADGAVAGEGEQPKPAETVAIEQPQAEPVAMGEKPKRSPVEVAAAKAADAMAKAARDAAVAGMVERVKNLVLLDIKLPTTGKTVRDSTGQECIEAGGWFAAVGKRVGDGIVGNVLSEAELQNIKSAA
jgi:hypothetical protein